jgi:hypothetical protein
MARNTQRGYLLIGLAIALAVSTSAGLVLWNRLGAAHKETARVTGEFDQFKAGVRKAGTEAEAAKVAALKTQKDAHDDAIKNLSDRHYALGVKYERLRDTSAGSPGSGKLPFVPDTTRPPDEASRDRRLLEVLRIAQSQTDALIGWIDWAEANKNSCGQNK